MEVMDATLIPGLTLTDTLYDAAAEGIARHVPDLAPLTREWFTELADWCLVPDDTGAAYKAEFVLLKTRQRTHKINLWFAPDLRGGQLSRPHNHPWDFRSDVLLGGYDEDRYEAGQLVRSVARHQAGAANTIGRRDYHEVTAIHEPGATLTLMSCGPGARNGWGYLDTDTGLHVPLTPDPAFSVRFAALNPHLR
jgi:hypothetical protein